MNEIDYNSPINFRCCYVKSAKTALILVEYDGFFRLFGFKIHNKRFRITIDKLSRYEKRSCLFNTIGDNISYYFNYIAPQKIGEYINYKAHPYSKSLYMINF